MLGKAIAVLVALQLAGCAAVWEQVQRDPRDAPWDPKPGQGQLIDQIPNWDGNAAKICCGHLRSCERHQTPRC